jgi:DNA-binding NarL/FixJ family response regulator
MTAAHSPWQALTRGDFLRSAWPWRSGGYLVSSALTGVPALLALVVLVAFSLVLVGLPLLILAGVALAVVERRRLRIVDAGPAPSPHRTPAEPGLGAWLRLRLSEQATCLLARFGHETVAAVGDADALRDAVTEHDPDIVVTDVRMLPGFQDEGLRAALALRAERPSLPLLVLSRYVQRSYAAELLDAGDGTGVGYLLKDRVGQIEEFLDAIAQVAAGGTVVDPEVVRQLLRRRRDQGAWRRSGRPGRLGARKSPSLSRGAFPVCAPPGTRTPDPLIKSQLL